MGAGRAAPIKKRVQEKRAGLLAAHVFLEQTVVGTVLLDELDALVELGKQLLVALLDHKAVVLGDGQRQAQGLARSLLAYSFFLFM